MTDPKIAPRIVDGEPCCPGEECPEAAPWEHGIIQCNLIQYHRTNLVKVNYPCLPGLRAQRDALQAERDSARRDYCEAMADPTSAVTFEITKLDHAASRGWSYLYEAKP